MRYAIQQSSHLATIVTHIVFLEPSLFTNVTLIGLDWTERTILWVAMWHRTPTRSALNWKLKLWSIQWHPLFLDRKLRQSNNWAQLLASVILIDNYLNALQPKYSKDSNEKMGDDDWKSKFRIDEEIYEIDSSAVGNHRAEGEESIPKEEIYRIDHTHVASLQRIY